MDVLGTGDSCNDWLVRFGAKNDEVIEDSAVYRDKTFDLRALPRNAAVTMIGRLIDDPLAVMDGRFIVYSGANSEWGLLVFRGRLW